MSDIQDEKNKDSANQDTDSDRFESWDTENFKAEILKLRKENGARRIKLNETSGRFDKLQIDYDNLKNQNGIAIEKLQDSLKEITEKHSKTTSDLESGKIVTSETVEELTKEYQTKSEGLSSQVSDLSQSLERERLLRSAYGMIHDGKYRFRNALEKAGFEASVLTKTEDGKHKTIEEVRGEVKLFLTDNHSSVLTPAAGPQPGNVKSGITAEIAKLMGKNKLTKEERDRLSVLSAELEKISSVA